MRDLHGNELPDSIRNGQRLTGMTSGQKSFPCVAPMFDFKKYGQHQTYASELIPHIGSIADEITIVKSMHTEAINHDPAITYINTGTQQLGHPSLGAWINYGLGSPNQNLPGYVVIISKGKGQSQALYSRLWGSGFLPSKHHMPALNMAKNIAMKSRPGLSMSAALVPASMPYSCKPLA